MSERTPREENVPTAMGSQRQAAAADVPGGAWEELFRQHHRMVFMAAHRVTGNAQDAEDVLQTVFLRLMRSPERSLDPQGVARYLRMAAVNGALDVVRSRRSARADSLEDASGEIAEDPARSPEAHSRGTELRERLREAVAALGSRSARAFTLRYFEGRDNAEIARMLGTTRPVVAVMLHRARRRLRDELRLREGVRT